MKKLISSFVIGTLLIASNGVFANGDITISGQVAAKCTLAVDSFGSQIGDLTTHDGEFTAGITSEDCNTLSGFKVFMYTDNKAKLKHENAENAVSYSVTYKGLPVSNLDSADSANKAVALNISSLASRHIEDSLVKVSMTGNENLPAGTYRDTIHLSIEAN